jgi:tetratricopeptide (TPR) repeat protein
MPDKIKLMTIVAATLVLPALLFAQSNPAVPQIDPGMAKALEAHRAGRMDEAIREYRAFLKVKPSSMEARGNLGAALAAQGLFSEAITEYKAALKLAPSNPGISFNLALAYYKTGELQQAVRELSALRALVGEDPRLNLLLADSWLQLGENDRVIRLLSPVADRDPSDLGVAYVLGNALMRAGKVYEGQKQLDKILRKGDSAEARLLMGTAKVTASDFAGALAEFQKAVEMNPKVPTLQAAYGQALMATGDTAGAAKAFEAELAQNPNDFVSNLNLAVLRKQDQQYADAMKLLDRALRLRPGDLGVRYQQATILLAENKVEPARVALESILKEAPKFVEAHVSLATVYYRLKRKADGDKERAIVQQLNAEAQEKQPKGEVTRQ